MSPRFFILLLLGTLALPALAQDSTALELFNSTRLDYNRCGMWILGSWALLNILIGALSAVLTRGQVQAFHQMNFYWNLVNLGIAGFGLWQANQISFPIFFWEVIRAQQQIEKILLFNTALDLVYMAIGFFLIEKGLRMEKERWIGFGKSILLQGAFLLLFDGILVGYQQELGMELMEWAKSIQSK
ncbi:MAG: hypothetical protein NBV61_06370 [Algoriphagus sp.]|nr:hypothetical protein [Algoriphagus sp.]